KRYIQRNKIKLSWRLRSSKICRSSIMHWKNHVDFFRSKHDAEERLTEVLINPSLLISFHKVIRRTANTTLR
ncbi:hypothetical protein L9F63_002930, partial [Diploptera punctata]